MIYVSLSITLLIGMIQTDHFRDLSGMSLQDVSAIEDGEILDPLNPQFKKILYRTGTVDPTVLHQWSKSNDTTIEETFASPENFRFHPFSMQARVGSISRFRYSGKQAKDFLNGFWYAECKTLSGAPFILISRSSVASWPNNEAISPAQLIHFDGFFFGNLAVDLDSGPASDALPVFIARRFAWYPDQQDASVQADAAKVSLAKAGVDISLLDIVKSRKGKSIGRREAVCFWQMLSASKKISQVPGEEIGLTQMLQQPVGSVGKAASVQGRVRQCIPVKVTSQKAIELLGTDTWHQLTIFPDLGGRPIEVATREGPPESYQNAFPVTVCVIDLPAGSDRESIVGKTFRCNGFFYRIWSYPSERTENSGLTGQPSPLIMASSLAAVQSTRGQLQTFLGAILLAMAIAVAFVCWYVYRAKKSTIGNDLPDRIEAW